MAQRRSIAAVALEPDVVVMDWQMPELDGVAATAAIRSRGPQVEVIAYSAADDGKLEQRFRRAGASSYVDKGDRAGLVAELRRHARRAREQRRRA